MKLPAHPNLVPVIVILVPPMVPPLVGDTELISAVLSSVYVNLVETVDSTPEMVRTASHSKSFDPKSAENRQQQGRVKQQGNILASSDMQILFHFQYSESS